MKNPFISVIIPTYNRKDLCKKAIHSVLNQTYKNFELIIVDDGSVDGTNAENLFDRNTKNITFIQQDFNYGVSKARNVGVYHSKGKWIAFLDSDDIWNKKKLEKQVAWIQKNPIYHINQTNEIWVRNNVRVNPPKTHKKIAGYIFKESLIRCMITPSSVMIKKSLFLKTGGFNESLPACEDYDLWLRITLYYPVGLVDECLMTRHGGHKDQLSSSVEVLDKYRIRALLNMLVNEKPDKEQKWLIYKTLIKKVDIVAKGLKKRGRLKEYEQYRKIADRYRRSIS